MSQHDEQLHRLLRQWRDLEPRPAFAVDVRRRIRLAEPVPVNRRAGWLPSWASLGAAVAVALVVGMWSGRQAAPGFAQPPTTFMAPDSLAGSYLKLTGGNR